MDPDPLVAGVTVENVIVLLGIAAVAYIVAAYAFERRDLRA